MNASRLFLIVGMALLLCAQSSYSQAPSPTPADALPVWKVGGALRQGGVLLITAPADSCTWLEHGYEMPQKPLGRCVLPIPVDTPPGKHPLKMGNGIVSMTRSIPIARTAFGHQSLTLSAAMLATYDSLRAKKEDDELIEVIRKWTPDKLWHGNFILPASGPRSTSFGVKRLTNGWRKSWHRGLDLAVGSGTPVRATNGGVVGITAHNQLVNGNCIVLQHGLGVASLYLHLSRIDVKPGQAVKKGQVIGLSGHSGAGTGPHLHWACYAAGVPVDPDALMHLPKDWW